MRVCRLFAFVQVASVASLGSAAFADAVSYRAVELYPLSVPAGTLGATPSPGPQVVYGGQSVGSAVISVQSPALRTDHAVVWTSNGTPIDLNPNGIGTSHAFATNGAQQVGYGAVTPTDFSRAFLWTGTAASAVNLHPTNLAGVVGSQLGGISPNGAQQVGEVQYADGSNHATVWRGTSASAVDLNPPGFDDSGAFGTDGTHQVGQAFNVRNGQFSNFHAILWSGSAASGMDLNPAGMKISLAFSVSGGEEVGYGAVDAGPSQHALLWRGTAHSVVDLNPTKFSNDNSDIIQSVANFTNDVQQAGYYYHSSVGGTLAMVWNGTADSATDLGSLLPTNFTSEATSIDPAGDVFGIARDSLGNGTAVEWVPVPEPSAMTLVFATAALIHRRA